MRSRLAVPTLAVVLALLLPRTAHAYLDPGTGSYVFQMVAAAIVSVGFVVRAYWHRLRSLFTRHDAKRSPGPPDER